MRLLPALFCVASLAIAYVAMRGCDQDCGDSVYQTQADIGPDGRFVTHSGFRQVYSEADMMTPLSLEQHGVRIVEEVRRGDGRFAQITRLMTVRFTASDAAGKALGGGQVTFLYPPIEYRGSKLIRSGRVPDSFANGLAGMRVGGERVFTAPVEQDEFRAFLANGSMSNVFTLPETGRVTYRVSLLTVCRPQVCVRTVYSIPATTSTEVYIKSCD